MRRAAASPAAGTSSARRSSSRSAKPDLGRVGEQGQPGGQAVGELLGVGVGDEAAAGHAAGGDDQVLAGQQPQRLTHGAAADPGTDAQLRLGRQPLAGLQPPGGDVRA